MAVQWLELLKKHHPDLAARAQELNAEDGFQMLTLEELEEKKREKKERKRLKKLRREERKRHKRKSDSRHNTSDTKRYRSGSNDTSHPLASDDRVGFREYK